MRWTVERGRHADEFVAHLVVEGDAPKSVESFRAQFVEDLLSNERVSARDAGACLELDQCRPSMVIEGGSVGRSELGEVVDLISGEGEHRFVDLDGLATSEQASQLELVEAASAEDYITVLREVQDQVVEHRPAGTARPEKMDVVDHNGDVGGAEVPDLVRERDVRTRRRHAIGSVRRVDEMGRDLVGDRSELPGDRCGHRLPVRVGRTDPVGDIPDSAGCDRVGNGLRNQRALAEPGTGGDDGDAPVEPRRHQVEESVALDHRPGGGHVASTGRDVRGIGAHWTPM